MSRPIEDYYTDERETRLALREWHAQNPLRMWIRAERAAGRFDPAILPVAISSIGEACLGRRRPTDTWLLRMEKATGIENLVDKWRRWEVECPAMNTRSV